MLDYIHFPESMESFFKPDSSGQLPWPKYFIKRIYSDLPSDWSMEPEGDRDCALSH